MCVCVYIYIHVLGWLGFIRLNGGHGRRVSYKRLGDDTVGKSSTNPYMKQKTEVGAQALGAQALGLHHAAALCVDRFRLRDCPPGNLWIQISPHNS